MSDVLCTAKGLHVIVTGQGREKEENKQMNKSALNLWVHTRQLGPNTPENKVGGVGHWLSHDGKGCL